MGEREEFREVAWCVDVVCNRVFDGRDVSSSVEDDLIVQSLFGFFGFRHFRDRESHRDFGMTAGDEFPCKQDPCCLCVLGSVGASSMFMRFFDEAPAGAR